MAGGKLSKIVFPARAGMIPRTVRSDIGHRRIPRESGDDPLAYLSELAKGLYSPRERG